MNQPHPRSPHDRAVIVAAEAAAELGESPLWDPTVGLRWLDITGRRLFTLGLDGSESSIALSRTTTAIELGPREDLLAVTSTGFGWLDAGSGQVEQVLTVIEDATVTMNDAAIDPHGRCWAGSAVRDQSRRGALYRLEGHTVTTQLERLGMSNGIGFSPAGDVLYHVDSTAGTITAWAYHPTSGELGSSRVLLSVPAEVGLPDGLTVDADGNLWVAIWGAGEVWCLDSQTGHPTATITVPTPRTSSCVFGGPDLSTLYITTAADRGSSGGGLLYAADVAVHGLAPHRFGGTLRS